MDCGRERDKAFVFTPHEYLRFGNKDIKSPPLINTSLKELAEMEWYLTVYARYVKGYSHTKLKYHFGNPDGKGHPYIVFKMWAKGNYLDNVRPPFGDVNLALVQLLVKHDLTPNFTKPPSFALMPLPDYIPVVQTPLIKHIPEDELEYLQRTNAEKLLKLKEKINAKGRVKSRDEVFVSQERMVG
jgi:hypothetical protein